MRFRVESAREKEPKTFLYIIPGYMIAGDGVGDIGDGSPGASGVGGKSDPAGSFCGTKGPGLGRSIGSGPGAEGSVAFMTP
jgi:hypothetical protein